MNILLIAYYFAPDRRVGALRASYWFKNLPNVMNCDVQVITANEEAFGEHIHCVRPTGKSFLSKAIKDPGLFWTDNLQKFLSGNHISKPDVVIITGGPFMHFGLADWLKKRYKTRVILDYRDPFAVNPGFKNSPITVLVKKYFERKFNRTADALITVNPYCAKIIELFNQKHSAIIQNGFDETVPIGFNEPHLGTKMKLVYTGKLYFAMDNFAEVIAETGHVLDYYGDAKDINHKQIINHGLVDYATALHAISKADVGVIQTYGEDFQSTTKLFDYIRSERPILIVSGNFVHRGSIHDELQNYPNVFWCENKVEQIKIQLERIEKHIYVKPDKEFSEQYSRAKQLEKLVKLIRDLKSIA